MLEIQTQGNLGDFLLISSTIFVIAYGFIIFCYLSI